MSRKAAPEQPSDAALPDRSRVPQAAMTVASLAAFAVLLWFAHARFGLYLDKRRALGLLGSLRDRWWAPLAFIGVYAVLCVLALPATLPTLVGGAAWGAGWGTLYNALGANIGATAAFLVARFLGREWIQALASRVKLGSFDKGVEANGFQVILTMRLIPIFPFNGINFGAGLSGIAYRDFAWATLIGMLPGTFIYTYFADSLMRGAMEGRAAFGRVAAAGVLLALLSFVPTAYRRWQARGLGRAA